MALSTPLNIIHETNWALVIWENEGTLFFNLCISAQRSTSLYRLLCKPLGQQRRGVGGWVVERGVDAYSLSSWSHPVLHPVSTLLWPYPFFYSPSPHTPLPRQSLQSSALITCIVCYELSEWLRACFCPTGVALMSWCPGAHYSTTDMYGLVKATLWLRANQSPVFKYIPSLGQGWHVVAVS